MPDCNRRGGVDKKPCSGQDAEVISRTRLNHKVAVWLHGGCDQLWISVDIFRQQ